MLLDHLLPMLLLLLPSSTCGMQALQRHPQRHRLQQPPSPHDAVLRAAYVEHTTELAAKTAAWALPPENCQENDPLVFSDADFNVAASVGNRHAGPDAASLYGGGMVYTTNAPILEPYECAYLIADADETMASGTAPGRFTYGGAVRDVRRLVMSASVPEAQLRATHHVVSASIPFSPLGAGARRGLPRLCARLAAAQAPLDLLPADRVAYANLGARTPECRSYVTIARTRCSHISSGLVPAQATGSTSTASPCPTRSSSGTTRRATPRGCRRTATRRCARSTWRSATRRSTMAAGRSSRRRSRWGSETTCSHAAHVVRAADEAPPFASGGVAAARPRGVPRERPAPRGQSDHGGDALGALKGVESP